MTKLTDLRDEHYRGINTKDLDVAASMIADDVVTVTPQGSTKGIDAFRQFGAAFFAAAPDAAISADRTFECGSTLITEGMYSGTQTGDLVGDGQTVPASGRTFTFAFVDLMTFENDKIVDHRIYWDNLGFMAQLGLLD
jgi:steroid delta-isomerase-like uncharacterized protein